MRHYSALAFATGAALAAVAGILLSSFRGVNPTMGAAYTLNALIVIVMGGIGNVAGGLVAGLILGWTQTLADMLGQSALGTVIVFAIFAAVLLWRPQGLFGTSRAAGVQQTGFRLPKETAGIVAVPLLMALPLVADAYWLLQAINILTYVALATAWAFFSGPTRYVSLAASAFYGLGAYCVAVLAEAYSYPLAVGVAAGPVRGGVGHRWARHAAALRHVLRDLHLRPRLARQRRSDVVGVQRRPQLGLVRLPLHHRPADLLPAARAVRRHRRPLALARPHPHGASPCARWAPTRPWRARSASTPWPSRSAPSW